MKLMIYLMGEDGGETPIYKKEDFHPCDAKSDKSIIDEAYDIAFRDVVFNYFDNGFGFSRHDIRLIDGDKLQSILSCSGRNVRYKFSEDGAMQIVENNSRPDRVFKIEIKK